MRISRSITKVDVPGIGTVSVSSPTLGMVRTSEEISEKVEEGERAVTFTNSLIAFIIVEPEERPEDISGLPEDAITALVNVAVDKSGIRDYFDDEATDIPVRKRFYQAFRRYEHEMFRSLAESVNNSLKFTDQFLESGREAMKAASVLKNVEESLKGLPDLVSIQNAIKLKSLLPENYLESSEFRAQLAQLGQIPSAFEEIAKSAKSPFLDLAKQIAKSAIREPFLTDSLILSGINSPLVHSPTYVIPRPEAPLSEDEINEKAQDAQRRRLVDAYDVLSQLEESLREVIERELVFRHGKKWWKQGVPQAVRGGCEERKRAKEKPHDIPHPPLTYAYFDDYRAVIMRGDNWREIFEPIFLNKVELEACFNLVGKVRDPIAHVRPISDEDYKMFMAGAYWLQARIKERR